MNAKQEAKLNMFLAVKKYCDDNMTIVNTVLAFATTFTAFKAIITALLSASQQEKAVTSGIVTDKKVSKKTLARLAADIAAPLFAFASGTNNNTLKAQANFSYTALFTTKDAELPGVCQNIHDAALTNLAALATYGITTPLLDALQAAING